MDLLGGVVEVLLDHIRVCIGTVSQQVVQVYFGKADVRTGMVEDVHNAVVEGQCEAILGRNLLHIAVGEEDYYEQ